MTPVTLITGFLGSGKTTLLKRLLDDPALSDTAVLINEFGEVGLDHHLLERLDDTMVLLQSGCLCCTIRGDLADALRDLLSRRERGLVPPFRRVVIESTGLADPFPVLSTLRSDPVLRHHFKAANVITALDAVNGLRQLDTYGESVRQVAIADVLVLTKTDIANEPDVLQITEAVRRLNPDAPMIRASDTLDADTLLNGIAREQASGFYCDEPVDIANASSPHGAAIRSFVITMETTVDWTAFGIWLTMLLHRHGDKILRVKGILNVEGEAFPVAIHGVQYLVHIPVHMASWPSTDRRSRIVFIVDGIEPALIERSFTTFNTLGVSSPALKLVEEA
ncbi:CobW family GTP-binding protein [Pararhizobium gei]|uniref:CobW family GTP-binding protein n=1 Tax=Pararhizobium gei TaxID=1395951 RepID=UPI0023DC5D8C|nr:GTP-binding protein [Rhizobium gei]